MGQFRVESTIVRAIAVNVAVEVIMLRNPMRPAAILALIAVSASLAPCVADPVELSTFIALARPAPTAVLQYGPSDLQAADLFLPSGDGPHPLAILIHGGCWSVTTAGREQLRHIGAELARREIAVWSIGYRRANEFGRRLPRHIPGYRRGN